MVNEFINNEATENEKTNEEKKIQLKDIVEEPDINLFDRIAQEDPNSLPALLRDAGKELFEIAVRSAHDPVKFHIFTADKLKKIAEDMVEINRVTRSIGRRNTFATNKFLTLQMLNGAHPYRIIRQCMSEIENRRMALKENLFRIKKNMVKLEELRKKYLKLSQNPNVSETKKSYLALQITELMSSISDTILYVEGCLKDIASFQHAYKQIAEKLGVYGKVDEVDFERAEIDFHVRRGFELLYRDLIKGQVGTSILEYLQQLGVHPQVALREVRKYIASVEERINKGDDSVNAAEDLEQWLDKMMEKYRHYYKNVMKRLGIDDYVVDWAMYKEKAKEFIEKDPQEYINDTKEALREIEDMISGGGSSNNQEE